MLNLGPKADDWWMIDFDEEKRWEKSRFWFDTVYIIVVVMIWLVVFPSLVIDTFKYMSLVSKEKEEDRMNICFICGHSRKEIEKYYSYKHHTEEIHNYWFYVYYIIYVLSKKDYTPLEKYVYEQVKQERLGWIPSLLIEYDFRK